MENTKPAYYNETKHSMHRRCDGWDYKGRGIYMLTLAVEGRMPLLGKLMGKEAEAAYIEMSDLGKVIAQEVENIPSHYPQIRVLCKQVMPDHLHYVLFVQDPLPVHLTSVITGFKTGCSRAFWQLYPAHEIAGTEHPMGTELSVITAAPGKEVSCAADFHEAVNCRNPKRPGLWEAGYNDRILFHDGQLDAMIHYVHDNPRRLWLKRANPDLFRIRRQTMVAGVECTTLGNIFLAERPQRTLLQCSRSLSQAEIDTKREACLAQADNGTVFISAAISEGEKQISRALRRAGYPMIILLQDGFPKPGDPHERYYKPGGEYFEACANEQLLLIEPSQALLDAPEIEAAVYRKAHDIPHSSQRYRFLALNVIGWMMQT